jgi:hypothetical protein
MQKYILLVKPGNNISHENFLQQLLSSAEPLNTLGATNIRINRVDHAVAAANSLRINQHDNPYQAMISFWLDDESLFNAILDEFLAYCSDLTGYQVDQREPIINDTFPAVSGERTEGMNQVVLLQQPPRLSRQEWLDIWLNSHGQIACDIQSTFGYRQNIVVKAMTDQAPVVDAIVEENFPTEAMSDSTAFYGCPGDKEQSQQRQQQMIDSVMRFIDFDKIECLPMSEYNF